MTRASSEFAFLNTGSKGKLETIKKQIKIVQSRFGKQKMLGHCIGLPGAGLQARRHRDEYRQYGVPDHLQVMVDRDPLVHKTQKMHMSRLKYTGKIVCNDLSTVVNSYLNENKKIDIIDYDDIVFLGPEHESIIRTASVNDVSIVLLTITNRCRKLTPYLQEWKKKLGLRKRLCKSGSQAGKLSEPVSKIHQLAIKTIAKECGYDIEIIPYAGRDIGPPMLSFVLLKSNNAI
jgi:hypothetical protein